MDGRNNSHWLEKSDPQHTSISWGSPSVITCLVFSHGRVIAASDDSFIRVYCARTGELLTSLTGHLGGVWSMAVCGNTLVSGSTDKTVRIWDLQTGQCKHVFGGHTKNIRCLTIVEPELADMNGLKEPTGERWPTRPLIVSGSRDHSLRVWTLPLPEDQDYRSPEDEEADIEKQVAENPYHLHHLEGHESDVRAVVSKGRIAASGSFDCTIRVWDIIAGECKRVLTGHTQRVYSVELDLTRKRVYSGSMDATARMWDLSSGQCIHVLASHTSLVSLLTLSPSYLVSASADATVRVWDPDTGELRHTLAGHDGAVTCLQHDDEKILSGSRNLKIWNIRDGSLVKELLNEPPLQGVHQLAFEGAWCAAASTPTGGGLFLDVWDFGGAASTGSSHRDGPSGENE